VSSKVGGQIWGSVFFPGEISLFFNKEIGIFLENFVSLEQIRLILLNCYFWLKLARTSI
jgi:hypothetical protein